MKKQLIAGLTAVGITGGLIAADANCLPNQVKIPIINDEQQVSENYCVNKDGFVLLKTALKNEYQAVKSDENGPYDISFANKPLLEAVIRVEIESGVLEGKEFSNFASTGEITRGMMDLLTKKKDSKKMQATVDELKN